MNTKLFAVTSLALSLAPGSPWAQAPSSSLKTQQPPAPSTPALAPKAAPIAAPISPGAAGFGGQSLPGSASRVPKGKESDTAQRRVESVPRPSAAVSAAVAATAPPASMGKKENMPSPRRAEIIAQHLKPREQENALAEQSRSVAHAQMKPTGASGLPARVGIESHSTWRKADEPGILMVNRKTRDFLVTPGGYLTIVGNAFGEKIGQVNLIGRFPGGKAALQVAGWRDDEIYALLPEGLRGAPDHAAVLQVITRDAKAYRKDAARFVAAREEITLTVGIDRVLEFKSIGEVWPTQMSADGKVSRLVRWQLQDCSRRTGTDRVKFRLPAGWQASAIGIEHGRTDTGDRDQEGKPGSRAFFPRYAIVNWDPDDTVHIDWGIWRSRNTALGGSSFLGDSCYSDYRLSVAVVGPAGVSPF